MLLTEVWRSREEGRVWGGIRRARGVWRKVRVAPPRAWESGKWESFFLGFIFCLPPTVFILMELGWVGNKIDAKSDFLCILGSRRGRDRGVVGP